MTERQDSTEVPGTPPTEPKLRYRLGSRCSRPTDELVEPTSPVRRPSTLIFDASPTTFAAALRKLGQNGPEATLSWTGASEVEPEAGAVDTTVDPSS